MKLRCIYSNNKDFIINKKYEVINITFSPLLVGKEYNIKDEKNRKRSTILDGTIWKFEIVKDNEMKELTPQQAFECKVGTKFEVIYEDGSSPENKIELCKDENEIISFVWDNKDDAILTKNIMSAKFIPIVEKEVSFMEAIKAYSEGNTIKNILDGNENIYKFEHSDYVEDKYGRGITNNEILEGKWYIID